MTRYWYHPESDSLFTTLNDEPGIEKMDPLVEEVDEATYRQIGARLQTEDAQWRWVKAQEANGVHAFTGHRPQSLGGYGAGPRKKLVGFAMDVLTGTGTEMAIVGMAQGWDQAVAQACINLDIPFVAAVPFTGQEQPWPREAQERYRRLLSAAQDVHTVADEQPSTPNRASHFLTLRNHWMVDQSSHLHALWDGKPKGGTANCIAYAERQQRPWTNHWAEWTNPLSNLFEDLLG